MGAGEDLGSWIPQLFYDLIARVVPGFTIIVVLTVSATLMQIIDIEALSCLMWKDPPAAMLVLAGYVFSYMSGFVFRGMYCLVLCRAGEDRDFDRPTMREYDRVKLTKNGAGSRLSKVRAEVHMCTILESGFVVAFVGIWTTGIVRIAAAGQDTAFTGLDRPEVRAAILSVVLLILFASTLGMHIRLLKRFRQELENSSL